MPESFDLTWSIPSTLLPSDLLTSQNIIAGFILDPLNPSSGKSAKDLLQKQKKIKIPRQKRNLKTIRRMVDGVEVEEEVSVKKKSKKKVVENTAFKSAQFVRCSSSFPSSSLSHDDEMILTTRYE